MTARMSVMPVLRAHARSLANGTDPDWITRAVMWGTPIGVGITAYVCELRFGAPTALLAGVALLMGGFLSTAGVLSTLRLKLTDRDESHSAAEAAERNLDEAVPHVLTAALGCVTSATLIIVAMNFPVTDTGAINRGFTCVIAASLTFVAVLFVATIVRLYAAYVQVNNVPTRLNGFTRRGKL